MNWISSQSEQELRISMNNLGEGEKGLHGAGRGPGQWPGNSATHLPEPQLPHLQSRAYPPC